MFSLEKGVSPTLIPTRIIPIPLTLLKFMFSSLLFYTMMSEYSDEKNAVGIFLGDSYEKFLSISILEYHH